MKNVSESVDKAESNIDSTDTLIFTSLSKEQANNLRAQINNEFPRVWVYVYNLIKKFEVKIASNWGGRIDKFTLDKVQNIVNKFKSENTKSSSSKS